MDVSAEAADVVVREGLQAADIAARLAADGMKNLAAFLLALEKQDFKVVGETTAKRLARENAPAVVLEIKPDEIDRFKKLAKDYGVLYFMVREKNSHSGMVNVVSNQNYAAQLNTIMEQMGYPIPRKAKEEEAPKKAKSRAPQEKSSPERGNGLNPSPTMPEATERESPTNKRLEYLKKLAAEMNAAPPKQNKTKGKAR